jgi:predicted AlkP superfamily phosphohydrolase/phosphomutase
MQVLEWATHDTIYGFRTTPSSMARTMRSSFGRYPLASCDAIRHGADDYRSLTDSLVAGVRAKTRLTKHFLGHGGWDFFMQVFAESHCIGHQCWHLHDNTHPAHDPAVVAAVGDPLRKVYIAIDAAVGELMDMIGDALVMLVVPHGMSYWYGAQFLLKPILFRLGVACPAPSPSHSRTGVARRMWRQLPKAVRERATPVYERLREKLGGAEGFPPIDVDTGKSRCFPQNNGLAIGGIRLNLAHREPTGVLQPGAEADAFCEDLTQDLLSIVQEDRGEPLVKRVLRTSQLYAGDCLDYLPDLLVEWSDAVPTGSAAVGNGEAAIIRARSPKIGVIEGVNHYARTGEHRQRGLFIAAGPNLKRGTLQREISILDLAPTFASLFSVHLPDCDGTPVHELLGRAPRAH